jgi:hypothetical protein
MFFPSQEEVTRKINWLTDDAQSSCDAGIEKTHRDRDATFSG